jgi:CheY-like chemotaxis protein
MLILLVEDDPAQLEPLLVALSQVGHIVDAVEDGETALWLIKEKDYDLLILDWMLPIPQFFEDKATEHLLGQGIEPEHLNEHKIGRVMDKLYQYG